MSRLIIVSNRLPYSIEKNGEGTTLRQSSGGLVSALKSYFEKDPANSNAFSEKIWVGSVDFSPQDWEAAANKVQGDNFTVEPIFIEQEVYNDYYNGFSNSTLWPLFHYFPTLADYQENFFEAYIKVNFEFANRIISLLKPGDRIWIHDYQLMLLPQILRRKEPDLAIGFFLHIPFPSYEIFRLMPASWKTFLLQGVLGADLIGFHTHDYVRHFVQSAKMVLRVEEHFNCIQYDNRRIKTDLFPIGIDYQKFEATGETEEVRELKNVITQKFPTQKIIFSVDRLDYSKGLMARLDAFAEFLEHHPEWGEQVVFILNVVPSRDTIPTYLERKRMMEEKISTINGKYSSFEWQPIIYRYNHLAFDELVALYQAADVALITPLRDGMNLVAKEFVASRSNQDGVLILSELTGAANELSEALLVNPTDIKEVANAIQTALTMPLEDQKHRMQMMQPRLKEYDVVRWVDDFLEQLENSKKEQERLSVKLLDAASTSVLLDQYQIASKRCILLDYDGTLSPFARIPSEAQPNFELLNLLEKLSADKKNEVVVISGRDSDTLDAWLGGLPVHLVAEHGAFIRFKSREWEKQTNNIPAWKDDIRPVLQLFVARCTGSLVEEKKNTLTWHYRNTHPDLGFIRSRELLNTLLHLTANSSLQVIDGNKVIEVRQQGVDKGITALKVLEQLQPDFVICIGDDTTDEDMFKALDNKGITIKIGTDATAAQYNIRSQKEVAPLLEQFGKSSTKQSNVYTQV